MERKSISLSLIIILIIISGCANPAKELQDTGIGLIKGGGKPVAIASPSISAETPLVRDLITGQEEKSADLTKYANNYYRYDPVAYQNALAEKKVVYLYFYANWCPICKASRPKILDAFNKINYDDVVGFEVHYNDDEVKDFDKDITRSYQIPYQHTTVISKNRGEVYRSLQELSTDEIIKELENARKG